MPIRIKHHLALAIGFSIFASHSTDAADLRMRFVYDGDPPPVKPLVIDKDVQFCGKHGLVDESLLVNQANGGIKNVAVYLYTGRRGTDLKGIKVPLAKKRQVDIDIKNCRFRKRVVIARVGDTLVWNRGDGVGHNTNFQFLNHPALGALILPNAPATRVLTDAEPAPIPVKCNIHPWEQAWLMVLEHPFAAVSDENGLLVIKGLPENIPLVFRAFHERLTFKQGVVVDAQAATWRLNKFQQTLSAETGDVITVKVPPRQEDNAK